MQQSPVNRNHGESRRVSRALSTRAVCRAASVLLLVWVAAPDPFAQPANGWRLPPRPEQVLPDSIDCWEPALAVGPRQQVFVVAGRRTPLSQSSFEQKLVIWRSEDGGSSFKGPWPVTTEGHAHYDQRVAVDAEGTVYVSYMDQDRSSGRSRNRLRLARSRDNGHSFSVETVTTHHVSDKPELAVSADGKQISVVYEASPGPILVTSHDGGVSWQDPRVVTPSEGRHFWPEALAQAPDGGLWFAVPSVSAVDIRTGRLTPSRLHVFNSADRGQSWRESDLGGSPRFVKGCAHDANCRVKGSRIGLAVDAQSHAYVVYTEGAGPGQVYGLFLRSSANAGQTWSKAQVVSAAPRPASGDLADHDFAMVAASEQGQLCVVWVDDRRGALDVWARCSKDAARTWSPDVLLSDRSDGAAYKSAAGFKAFYGHYGGVAIDTSRRLHAVWAAGEPEYRTGSVWVNRLDLAQVLRP